MYKCLILINVLPIALCCGVICFPLGGCSIPGVSITIILGQYLYSIRILISRASKLREGSRSNLLFSDSI